MSKFSGPNFGKIFRRLCSVDENLYLFFFNWSEYLFCGGPQRPLLAGLSGQTGKQLSLTLVVHHHL